MLVALILGAGLLMSEGVPEDPKLSGKDFLTEFGDLLFDGTLNLEQSGHGIVALEKGDRTEEEFAGGPRASSCTEIEAEIPGILDFIAEQRLANKAGKKFQCLGAWRTEGPDARAAWVKYKIRKSQPRVCEVRALFCSIVQAFSSSCCR